MVHMFTFEPGDGTCYQVLFGHLPGQDAKGSAIVFGIAPGRSDPGLWCVFHTVQVDLATFHDQLNPWGTLQRQTFSTAWRLWLALTGQADDPERTKRLPAWRTDWRDQLPPRD